MLRCSLLFSSQCWGCYIKYQCLVYIKLEASWWHRAIIIYKIEYLIRILLGLSELHCNVQLNSASSNINHIEIDLTWSVKIRASELLLQFNWIELSYKRWEKVKHDDEDQLEYTVCSKTQVNQLIRLQLELELELNWMYHLKGRVNEMKGMKRITFTQKERKIDTKWFCIDECQHH